MNAAFTCPHCGQTYSLTPEQAPSYAGQNINCTACGAGFRVPDSVAQLASAPPPITPQRAQVVQPEYVTPMLDRQPTSGMAITSLVCGCLLCVPVVTGLAAVIFGILGIRQTKSGYVGGRGMAIAGLVLGILNLAGYLMYFLLIAAIAIPAAQRARAVAQQAKVQAQAQATKVLDAREQCRQNLTLLRSALQRYASVHNGQFPPSLDVLVSTDELQTGALICPDSKDTAAPGPDLETMAANVRKGGHLSYLYFAADKKESELPANAVLAAEPLSNHNNRGINVIYADGKVKWLSATEARRVLRELNAGNNPPGEPGPE